MVTSSVTLDHLHTMVTEYTGLTIPENRFSDVLRSLSMGISESESDGTDVTELLTTLSSLPFTHALWQRVLSKITIGETYFFRNQGHFAALQNFILPKLIDYRRGIGQKYLRIWSAGCATGEEPYSIAILLQEMLPDIKEWFITILGTDINIESLDAARLGLYKSRSFRSETRDDVQSRWFTEVNGGYLLSPIIRQMVRFHPLNLVSDVYPTYDSNTMSMDIILCRNVTIYFSRAQTTTVASRFYEALSGDGWLIVGHSEPQSEVYQQYVTNIINGVTCYQKKVTPPTTSSVDRTRSRLTSLNTQATSTAAQIQPKVKAPVMENQQIVIPNGAALEYWKRARHAADQEDWEEALKLLSYLESENILQPQVHYLRGLIFMQLNRREDALSSMRRAVYCDPDYALAIYALGEIFIQQSKPVEAVRYWKQAQRALTKLNGQAHLAFEDDLTVESFNDLLAYRIQQHGGIT